MTATLRQAIQQSDESYYMICAATGIQKSSLGRFMSGKTSLRLDLADKLAAHFGLVLRKDE